MKITFCIIMLLLIVSLAFFGSTIKEKSMKGILQDIPEYNCGEEDICTSCIINEQPCSCGTDTCSCGNDTVDKAQCQLFN